MKKLIPLTAFLVLAALAACTTNPVTTNLEAIKKPVVDTKKTQVLGVLEVEISSEQGSVSSAKFIAANSGLSAKGVAVPINGTTWKFTPGTTTFMTDANFKYLQNTITLENKTGSGFQNLTMYALNTATNLGGTAFSNIKTLAGVPLTGASADNVARAVMPTHGMNSVTTVDASKADMMVYTPAEVAAVQAQLVAPGFTMVSPKVLEYGFVARNFSGTARAIGTTAAGCPSSPTCNKAKITWAFKFPLSLPGSSTLGKFSMQYVVVNEPGTFATQSLEEQTAGTVAGLSTAASSSVADWRTLGGTGISGAKVNPVCGAITAMGTAPVFMGTARVSGELDTCFATGGYRSQYVGSATCNIFVYGLLNSIPDAFVQSDGKTLFIGNNLGQFGLVRLNRDGSIDESFGAGGCVKTAFANTGEYYYPYSGVIQPDGKIVVVGSKTGSNDWALARFNSDGTMDATFDGPSGNGNGQFSSDFGGSDFAGKVMLQTIGGVTKLVVVGRGVTGFSEHLVLARFSMTDGSFDTTFNTTGYNSSVFSNGFYSSAVLDSTNRVIVAGGSSITRFTANGVLDTSFATNGVKAFPNAAYNVALGTLSGVEKMYIAADNPGFCRYDLSGTLDTSFNAPSNCINFAYPNSNPILGSLSLADGRVLAVRQQNNSNNDTTLRRYMPDGSLDLSFGTNGIPSTRAIGLFQSQPDGKVLASGTVPGYNPGLIRIFR
jgi:uncharacterized delta-60 repeat protein